MVQFLNFNAHFVLFIHTTLNAITRYLLNKEPNKFTQLPWTMYWVFSSKEAAMKKIVPGKKSRRSRKSSNIFLLEILCPHYISREWKAWCESSVMLDTTTTESIQILLERTTRKSVFSRYGRGIKEILICKASIQTLSWTLTKLFLSEKLLISSCISDPIRIIPISNVLYDGVWLI